MKKTILTIMLCGVMILEITGCGKEKEKQKNQLQDTYKIINEYFGNEKVDRSNLGGYSKDEENNQVIVALVDNSKEKQEEFIKQTNVSSKYIKFIEGGPYNVSQIDFYISKPKVHTDIKFNDYYKSNGRTIYLAGNIEEFYIISGGIWSLQNFIPSVNQTFERSIEEITDKLDKKDILKDGGTIIYKSKEKDITMVVCNTLDKNKDIFIGDYSMNFDNESMCK